MDWKTLLAELATANEWGDDITTPLTEAYDLDMGAPLAKVAELEAIIAAQAAEIDKLKIWNYDKLMAQGSEKDSDETDETETKNENTDILVDDLFEDETDNESEDS